jgi:hypothetical protein
LDFCGEPNANVFVCFLLLPPVFQENIRRPLWFRSHAKLPVAFRFVLLSLPPALHISMFISAVTSFPTNPLPMVHLPSVLCSRPEKISPANMADLAAVNVCFVFCLGVFCLLAVLRYFVGVFGRPVYECTQILTQWDELYSEGSREGLATRICRNVDAGYKRHQI